jgi:two-component system nitrate/nitrite sensor histidine kinase NarX
VKDSLKIFKINTFSPSTRRMAAGISLLVILIFVGALWIWPQNNLGLSILFGLAIAGVIYFIAGRFIQLQSEILTLQRRLAEVEADASSLNRRANAVFQLSRKFVEADDEDDVVSSLLKVSVDLFEAVGASVVPLDERGQPLTAISYGEIPTSLMDSWVEYLASPEIRHRCQACQKTGTVVEHCPLVEIPVFANQDYPPPTSVYCLHLHRGGREYGVLNLYLSQNNTLDSDTQEFMHALLDETALVLESIRLQNREIKVLQQLRHQSDLKDLELDFIENVQEALKADFVLLTYQGDDKSKSTKLSTGEFPESRMTFIDGIIDGVLKSGLPVLLGEVEGDPDSMLGIHSLIAAPLVFPDEPAFGVLVAGNFSRHKFNSRHLTLLQTLAGQVGLVVRNSKLWAEMEFNTIIAERTRLAREIHDGLAQTLGFLKLQAAQMGNLLAANDTDRLQDYLSTTYKILSDAYLDVRQAIDGLRISPNGEGLSAWLKETCLEFEENTDLPVILDECPGEENLPPEIQVQLIRIIQEALSNVRKHSCATQAWVSYRQTGQEFVIEVRDDGKGFSPEEIPSVSRYGLQGMRERSELIGADFQVISLPGEGTTVNIRVPLLAGDQVSE